MNKSVKYQLLIFFLFTCITNVFSQNSRTITGQVKSKKTHEPMHMANVYLLGTNFGDAVNQRGDFEIRNIPPGKYKLIISMIGFKKVEINVDLNHKKRKHISVFLKEEALQGETITIEADEPVMWKKNLKKFKNAFFGLSKFASDCKLLNPEVLDFQIYKGKSYGHEEFRASTVKPLEFINNALGYKVSYEIFVFRASLRGGRLFYIDGDFRELGPFVINGKRKFTLLEAKNETELEKWEKNRRSVYKGSLRHFLYSLVHNSTEEAGFTIRSMLDIKTSTAGKIILPQTILRKDTLAKKYFLDLANQELEGDDNEFYIIQIKKYEKSTLHVPIIHQIEFDTKGVVVSYPDFCYGGYWGWHCSAAHWLPEGYVYISNEDD